MIHDINTIRKQNAEYRRRFCAKWSEVYHEPFQHEVLRTKRWLSVGRSHAAQDFLETYQRKIQHIKSLLEP